MSDVRDIIFVKDNATQHLDQFTEDVRAAHNEAVWRCLYVALDPEIIKEPAKKTIATAFLESAFDHAFEVQAFWLHSGHLFIFSRGRCVRSSKTMSNSLTV
jgi:hypothetical protein